ncbi:hypothetical protein EK21DRAFT_14307, partial [Setomelanomma holmii]
VLSALIENGVPVNSQSWTVMTSSMHARLHNRWSQWCRALEFNGKHVRNVLEAENNFWLLGIDWQAQWKTHKLHGHEWVES